jgi:hypothetical protein
MTFKGKTEMAEGQQLMVRSGISVFCRIERVGEKCQGFPGATRTLLEHGSHMGVRCMSSEGKFSCEEGWWRETAEAGMDFAV